MKIQEEQLLRRMNPTHRTPGEVSGLTCGSRSGSTLLVVGTRGRQGAQRASAWSAWRGRGRARVVPPRHLVRRQMDSREWIIALTRQLWVRSPRVQREWWFPQSVPVKGVPGRAIRAAEESFVLVKELLNRTKQHMGLWDLFPLPFRWRKAPKRVPSRSQGSGHGEFFFRSKTPSSDPSSVPTSIRMQTHDSRPLTPPTLQEAKDKRNMGSIQIDRDR